MSKFQTTFESTAKLTDNAKENVDIVTCEIMKASNQYD